MNFKSLPTLAVAFRVHTEKELNDAIARDVNPHAAYLAALKSCRLLPAKATKLNGLTAKGQAFGRSPL